MIKRIGTILVCILLIASSLVIVYPIEALKVNGITLYVGGYGPGNYTRIQDAIDNASSGDTVFVYSGTYYENIIVDKSINLYGENKHNCIIDSRELGEIILTINSSQVILDSFTIINGSNYSFCLTSDGIKANSVDYLKISNLIITDCYKAIRLIDSTNIIIENCHFYNNKEDSILGEISENLIIRNCLINNTGLQKAGGFFENGGITFSSTNKGVLNLKIYNCTFRNIVGKGISTKGQYINSEIYSNDIDNVSIFGIYIIGDSLFDIYDNYIRNCGLEIDVKVSPLISDYKLIHDNIIINDDNGRLAGISVLSSNSVSIINNSISSVKKYGILIQNSSKNIVDNNKIETYQGCGIRFFSNCNDNIISNNYVKNSHLYNIGIINESFNNTIYRNTLINAGTDAVYIIRADNNLIEMNNIYNNSNGITIGQSRHNMILSNNFINNDPNAYVSHSLDSFLFAGNIFKDNYWDDYSGEGPKKIDAVIGLFLSNLDRYLLLNYYKFDWNPAQEPYDIPILDVP